MGVDLDITTINMSQSCVILQQSTCHNHVLNYLCVQNLAQTYLGRSALIVWLDFVHICAAIISKSAQVFIFCF